jgi:hypothetical protein
MGREEDMKFPLCLILLIIGTGIVHAQTVESIGFCRDPGDKTEGGVRFVNPVGCYAQNDQKTLKQLPIREGRRSVYAIATLTAETAATNVVFVFQRIGASEHPGCSAEDDQDFKIKPDDLQRLKTSSETDERISKLERVRRRIANLIGGSELGIGSIKVKVVTTGVGQRSYYDYRFVECPGKVRVWVTDQDLNLLAPESVNNGKTLEVR